MQNVRASLNLEHSCYDLNIKWTYHCLDILHQSNCLSAKEHCQMPNDRCSCPANDGAKLKCSCKDLIFGRLPQNIKEMFSSPSRETTIGPNLFLLISRLIDWENPVEVGWLNTLDGMLSLHRSHLLFSSFQAIKGWPFSPTQRVNPSLPVSHTPLCLSLSLSPSLSTSHSSPSLSLSLFSLTPSHSSLPPSHTLVAPLSLSHLISYIIISLTNYTDLTKHTHSSSHIHTYYSLSHTFTLSLWIQLFPSPFYTCSLSLPL